MLYHVQDPQQIFKATPTHLQGASRMPLGRLQDATRCLQAAYKTPENRSPIDTMLQAASKERQRLLKTPPKRQNHFQAASEKPPRRPKTSPREFQNGISHENMQFSSPSEPTTTSVAYAQAVLLCTLLPISNNS